MKRFKTLMLTNRHGFKSTPWQITVPKAAVDQRPVLGHYVFDLAETELEIQSGPSHSRMTATRVLGGGALLGPVGLLLGGMARKDLTYFALVLSAPGVFYKVEFSRGEWRQAQEFVEAVALCTSAQIAA